MAKPSSSSTGSWTRGASSELPKYWHALTNKIPDIAGQIPGEKHLTHLDSWLRRGLDDDEQGDDNIDLPNMLIWTWCSHHWLC